MQSSEKTQRVPYVSRLPFRVEKTKTPGMFTTLILYSLSVVLALSIGGVFLSLRGHHPLAIYIETFGRVFGTWYGISETLVKACPIIFGALGVILAGKIGLWNVGIEGQFLIGAYAASGVALYLAYDSSYILVSLMAIAGFLAGSVFAILFILPRTFFGVNEILTTLLSNYIAALWVSFFVHGPWKDPTTSVPQTCTFGPSARLPVLPGSRVHLGLALAIICCFILGYALKNTKWGFEIRALGSNVIAARSAGISLQSNILLVMLISGGLGGIGGMVEVSGTLHRLQMGIFPMYNLTAIAVSWLARLNPFIVPIVGFGFSGLLVAGYIMQISGLPSALVSILQGIILFTVLGCDSLRNYRIVIIERSCPGRLPTM